MARHSQHCPADFPALRLPELLRAARLHRSLSQRELAERAGLPKTTIGRLESGETSDPALSTVERALGGAGLSFVVVDDEGAEISHLNAPGPQRDTAGRRLPAHLKRRPLDWDWWGWYRVAWEFTDDPRPEWIYEKRPPLWLLGSTWLRGQSEEYG